MRRYLVLPIALLLTAGCSTNSSEPDFEAPAASKSQAPGAQPLPPNHPPVNPMPPSGATPGQPGELGPEQAGSLTFHGEAPFVRRPPGSSMRAAEYIVADAPDSPLTVFYFPGMGGGVDANITRWLGQFTPADGKSAKEAAEITKSEVKGIAVTRVELKGQFGGGMAMPSGKAPAELDNAMLLGAIAEGPKGPVFFKWTGPAALLEANEKAFDALIASLSPAS